MRRAPPVRPGAPVSARPRGDGRLGDALRDARGSGTVLAVALLAVAVTAALGAGALASALTARQRIVSAADSSALAAADALSGAVAGEPCAVAGRLASVAGTRLDACAVDGATVQVLVSGTVLGVTVTAAARAGPPPEAALSTGPEPGAADPPSADG